MQRESTELQQLVNNTADEVGSGTGAVLSVFSFVVCS